MNEIASRLLRKIEERRARIGVIGLGYVGLPLAVEFARKGFPVTGFDVDEQKTARINRGESYIRHIPPAAVRTITDRADCHATTSYDELAEVDCILICVPTPLTAHREPDMTYIEATTREIAPRLREGQLVVLESTTYPGTTRELVRPLLDARGLSAGHEYFLAFSPEREDPGNPDFSTRSIPKVIGGLTESCSELSHALYRAVTVGTVAVSSPDAAEATKLLENIFRAVNIALVNELKMVFDKMGIDVWEVIRAASTKPFGYMPFYPGPGLGGHCIPIDPFYLTWRAREFECTTRFIELAGEINTAMPDWVVRRLDEALDQQGKPLSRSSILLLGLAYKQDVDDMRESPALRLIDLLRRRGARVAYHDPHIPELAPTRHYDFSMQSEPLTPERLAAADAVLIVTAHRDVDYAAVARHASLVVDTRNVMRDVAAGRATIVQA